MKLIISKKSNELGSPEHILDDINSYDEWLKKVTVLNVEFKIITEDAVKIKGPNGEEIILAQKHIIEINKPSLSEVDYKILKINDYHFWFVANDYLYGYKYGYLGKFIDVETPKIIFTVKELIKQNIINK